MIYMNERGSEFQSRTLDKLKQDLRSIDFNHITLKDYKTALDYLNYRNHRTEL